MWNVYNRKKPSYPAFLCKVIQENFYILYYSVSVNLAFLFKFYFLTKFVQHLVQIDRIGHIQIESFEFKTFRDTQLD